MLLNKIIGLKAEWDHVGELIVRLMRSRAYNIALLAACFFLGGCGDPKQDYVKRYDKPLTYAEAAKKKDIDFPLPPSSHHIYHGLYGYWQAYTLIVRFEAPVEDCLKHIDAVIAWDDKVYNRTSSYPRIAVTNVEPVDAGFLTPTPWFNPDKISHGIHVGEAGSHTPQIWVDLNKGIFYFRETD